MNINKIISKKISLPISIFAILTGLVTGYQIAQAQRAIQTEHKGIAVSSLGVISESSLQSQIGLEGYKMQLREIVVEPGGQIAKHDHFKRPGLVLTLSGTWIEGRPDGEREYPASLKQAILEDQTTEHWFWNDSAEPVSVAVCDIVPST
jgi:quercetin dioxygenase-like cupin family protein